MLVSVPVQVELTTMVFAVWCPVVGLAMTSMMMLTTMTTTVTPMTTMISYTTA
jgi:hypothetical protein